MNEQQWRDAWKICQEASRLSGAERRAFVASATSDPEIAAHVLAVFEGSDQPPPPFPEQGARIGRYVVRGLVGKGGMGQVYAAEDTELDRTVALKFLSADLIVTHSATARFIREAKAASALNHPNIVTVHEVIRSEYGLAIAMELVEGSALRDLCGSPLPIGRVIDLGRQIAEALAAAHSRGIVHRDIKPENVVVRPDGYVKILDFGLARQAVAEANTEASIQGLPAGTWRYMSPEQTRGEPLTGASDVFSLGLVLYEMTTGANPVPAGSPFEIAGAIARLAPGPPSARNPQVPRWLDALILRMLEHEPARRPAVADVARALSTEGREEPARPAPRRKHGRPAIAAAAIFAAVAIAFLLWNHSRHAPSPEPVVRQVTTNESENLVTAAAVSANGKLLAFADPDGMSLRTMQSGETRPLRSPAGLIADRVAWSADGLSLLVSGAERASRSPTVWSVSITGAAPALVRAGARNAAPSPNGERIAFTAEDEASIWIADRTGAGARQLVSAPSTDKFPVLFWSADGKRLLYSRRRYAPRSSRDWEDREVFEDAYQYIYESVDAGSGKLTASAPDLPMNSACALADGRVLFLRWGSTADILSHNFWLVRTDPATGAVIAPPQQITHLKDTPVRALTASADGKVVTVILQHSQADIFVGDLEAAGTRLANVRRLTLDSKDDYPHAWTRDSRTVFFESSRRGTYDLYRQELDERVAHQIVGSQAEEVMPQPTPDGRWILYDSRTDFKEHAWRTLMRVPVEGGTPEPVPLGGQLEEFRCPQRSGSCVLREVDRHQQFIFYELDPVKGKGRELARTGWIPSIFGDWDVSPDGRLAVMPYHDTIPGRLRIVELDPSSSRVREREIVAPAFSGFHAAAWAADGKSWFVGTRTKTGAELIHVDPGGSAQLLRDMAGSTYPVPSPDGRKLAFPDQTADSNVWSIEW